MKLQTLIHVLILLFISTTSMAKEVSSYICESSHQDNGETKEFKVSRTLEFDHLGVFKEFKSSSPDGKIFFSRGRWYQQTQNGVIHIDLNQILDQLSLNSRLWLKFSPDSERESLNISPIILPFVKGDHQRGEMVVRFYEPSLPIYESIGLPFNAHYVKSSDLYIEYSFPNKMINRIEQSAKSSYIKKSHVCMKKKIKVESFPIKQSKDITFQPELWPINLHQLKKSIALITFDNNIYSPFANKIKSSVSSTYLIQRSKKSATLKDIEVLKPYSVASDKKSNLKLFFSKDHYIGNTVYSTKLDKTKKAQERYAYIPNKSLNLQALSRVTINRLNNQHYFYFHNDDKSFNIAIGPLSLETLFWRKEFLSKNTCLRNVQKHFSEYERKSFIFKKLAYTQYRDPIEIQRAKKYRHYPVDSFILTNNCRSLGSYEYEIPGIVKGYFQIPPKVLIDEVKELFDFDWKMIKTETRSTKFYEKEYLKYITPDQSLKDKLTSIWSRNFEKNYTWFKLSDFEGLSTQCKSKNILNSLNIDSSALKKRKIKFEKGFINFNRFLHETRKKSSDIGEDAPLSYVRTPCSANSSKPPYSFRPPKHLIGITGKQYWQKGTCEWIPHQFYKYSEIIKYDVGLSAFDVDGVYTGHNHSKTNSKKDFKKELLKNDKVRKSFSYKNIYSFSELKYSIKENQLSLILSNKDESFNLLISGIDINQLESRSSRRLNISETRPWYVDNFKGVYNLIGIYPYPLASEYNSVINNNTVSLFYNKKNILDHHKSNIGVEQWYLTKKEKVYTLDLISHERILPVAKISFELE